MEPLFGKDANGNPIPIGKKVTPAAIADEIFADNFAAMYGYGYDLIRGLKSMSDHYNGGRPRIIKYGRDARIYDIDSYDNYFAIKDAESILSARRQKPDEHPRLLSRTKNIMSQLYIDKKHNPNMASDTKKRLDQDIVSLKKLLTDFKSKNYEDILARGLDRKMHKQARRIANPAKFDNFKFLDPNAR